MLLAHKAGRSRGAPDSTLDSVFAANGVDVHCSVRLPESGALVTISISAFRNVAEHAMHLGVDLPTALLILPSNFERAQTRGDLAYDSATWWLSSTLSEARVPHTVLLPDQSLQRFAANRAGLLRDRLDGTAPLPVLCATPRFVLQTPQMFTFVTEEIFAAAQMALGKSGDETAKIELVIGPRAGRYVKFTYVGPTSAANPVADTVRRMLQDDGPGM
ncbi:MAG TPA: hypothetical protein VNJ51_03920 [Candidatus Dormibacteraeota bacterium]|nr:hypothetical protein [Candidatus Dormibacteraeota bacterium]